MARTSPTVVFGVVVSGVADDARLKAFDFAHFCRLLFGRHVFVDDGDAAQLGERNSKPRFGDGVHRRGKEGGC